MIELMLSRRSIRKFNVKPLENEKINKIIQAGALAPSSMNKKPVELYVLKEHDKIEKLIACKKNGTLALTTAPLAIIVTANKSISDVYVEDATIAATYMMLEAEKLGLGCCFIQMRNRKTSEKVDSEQAIKDVFNLKDELGIICVLAFGHKEEIKEPYTTIDTSRVYEL